MLSACPRTAELSVLPKDYCGEIDSNCSRKNKKTGERTVEINKAYFKDKMQSRAQFLLWFESKQREELPGRISRSGKMAKKVVIPYTRMDGFMTAYIKGEKPDKTFYIDLVCSRYGKGKALLEEAERIAKDEKCQTTSLRAATAPLIAVYQKKFGYQRRANACKEYGRAERAALYEKNRPLDKSVVCRGLPKVECTTKCSWVEPTNRSPYCRSRGRNTVHMGAADFEGRRMGTGDGWWMSKCLS